MVVHAEKDTGHGVVGADGRRVQRVAFLEEEGCSDGTVSEAGALAGPASG